MFLLLCNVAVNLDILNILIYSWIIFQAARRPGYYTPSGAFMGFDSENESSDTEDVERVGNFISGVLR